MCSPVDHMPAYVPAVARMCVHRAGEIAFRRTLSAPGSHGGD